MFRCVGGKPRKPVWAGILTVAASAAIANGGSVAVCPTNDTDEGLGYGQYYWPQMTADINTAAGTPVATVADLSNLTQLLKYNGLWVDVRFQAGLTAIESANLQAYIATGRRVVVIGSNVNYGQWDTSVLSAFGGSYNNGSYTGTTPTLTPGVLTFNVSAGFYAPGAGLAPSGSTLFEDRVATMWGPARNALVILDTEGFASDYISSASNTAFAANVAAWVAGNTSDSPSKWMAGGSGSWVDRAQWNTTAMPGAGDDAVFSSGSNSATISSPVVCRDLLLASDRLTLNLPAGGSLGVVGAITVSNNSTLSLAGSVTPVTTGSVNISTGSTLTIGAGTTLAANAVSGAVIIAGSTGRWTGRLDLGAGSADLTGTTLAAVTDQVRQGFDYASGAKWDGQGITSSAAGSDSTHVHALGIAAGPSGDVLVKYTVFGDANLDGKVDGSDYTLIDAGNASAGRLTGWAAGDFNYDGVVDGSDYALIDNAFNSQAKPDAAATTTAVVAVPEPSGMLFVGVGLFAAKRRRRSG
jgi:hypothetical protein